MEFSFKTFLEARSLPVDSQERHFLLSALNKLIKRDWSDLLIYADWLQERGEPLGEYIGMVYENIKNRSEDSKYTLRFPKFKRSISLDNQIYDTNIKDIKNWYYVGGFGNDEWSYSGPIRGKKPLNIAVYNLRFYKLGKRWNERKSISWNEVPTELLKAGLAIHLRKNFFYDTAHHHTVRGVRNFNPPTPNPQKGKASDDRSPHYSE